MTLNETIQVLERHNKWRRGADIPMEHPKAIGEAIDTAIHLLKQMEIKK